MTKFVKKDQLSNSWYEIDAKNAVVGRLATIISKIIRGKNKTTYTPHMDHGDFVIVKNIEQIKFTGKKFQIKNIIDTQVIQVELKKLHLKNFMKKNQVKL
jgi:large subunit ribosomal protein L13